MVSAKRLSLQLTPLLDLLLIVIFAQYLEMEQTSIAVTEEQASALAKHQYQLSEAEQELAFTKEVLAASQKFRTQAEQQLQELEQQQSSERIRSQTTQQQLNDRLEDVSQQRDSILSAVKQAFANSSQEVRKILEKLAATNTTPQPISPDQIETMAQTMAAQPRDLATFLLAYEEIRKRCDLWEIHLNERGIVTLFDGQKRHSLRAVNAEDFQRQLFDLYKSLPQTKGLVILLVSYGDVRADTRQVVLMSLPTVTERMRADSDGRTRFEYAVLGYLPESPLAAPEDANAVGNP